MSDTTIDVGSKPQVPEFLRKPVTAFQTRVDELEIEARRGLGGLLQSSNASLHELDLFLERLAREDWTMGGMRRKLLSFRNRAENASTSALRRFDELPGAAVSAIASASRARVQDLSRGLQAIAKRIEPPVAAAPAPKQTNGA